MANTQGPQSTSKCESHLCSKVDKEERKPILERTDQEIKLTKLAQYLHSTVTLMKQETVKWCDVIGERKITPSVQLEFGGWKKWQYDGPPHGTAKMYWRDLLSLNWPYIVHGHTFYTGNILRAGSLIEVKSWMKETRDWNEFSWSNYFPGLKHLGVALFGSVGPLHPLLLLHLLHLAHNPTPQGRH